MERDEKVKKANQEVADFLANLKPKKYEDGWPEDRWQEEMEKHPFFLSKPLDEGQELPPLVEALQQLKYDPEHNSPEELARSYKDDGNACFEKRNYRWAVDSYTKGIEAKSTNVELNAQLYLNRAAASFHIGNFQKALKDAAEARTLKPDYIKAFQRGAQCYWELKEFNSCITWCKEGLKLDPMNKLLLELKKKAEAQKKIADRNKRKAMVQEAKKKKEAELIMQAVKERGICLAENSLDFTGIGPKHPAWATATVHIDGEVLVWPVIFMYPEYGTTDYIQEFYESSTFLHHLNIMFNPDDPPAWDKNHQYIPDNLQVYFNDNGHIMAFDKRKTLKEALSHERYRVHAGRPCFIITVQDSAFDKVFREKNA